MAIWQHGLLRTQIDALIGPHDPLVVALGVQPPDARRAKRDKVRSALIGELLGELRQILPGQLVIAADDAGVAIGHDQGLGRPVPILKAPFVRFDLGRRHVSGLATGEDQPLAVGQVEYRTLLFRIQHRIDDICLRHYRSPR